MFKFTDDYKIGVTQIDTEHEKLFGIINETGKLLKDENANIPVLAKNLQKELINYASTHFQHEETYMKEICDPELPRQKKEHDDFIHKVSSLSIDGMTTPEDLTKLMEFLVQWLFHHIICSDMMIGQFKNRPETSADPFAFTDNFKTGIELIDEEHKNLFDIVRTANELIRNTTLHDKYDPIINIINELKEYTVRHFTDEEAYMEAIGYPKLPEQKRAHEAFIEKLIHIDINELEEIDDNQQEYLFNLIDYLLNWLTNHILMSDKLIGEYAAPQKKQKTL